MARRSKPARRVRYVRMCEEQEWPLMVARASALGVDPSTYLREAALREARRELSLISESEARREIGGGQ